MKPNHTLNLHRSTNSPWLFSTQNSDLRTLSLTNQLLHFLHFTSLNWTVAPFVFKKTPLHGSHGKRRLPLLWMHVLPLRFLATDFLCLHAFTLRGRHRKQCLYIVEACSFLLSCSLATSYKIRPIVAYSVAGCLSSRCLVMLWANPSRYYFETPCTFNFF
jgi:hypothetical protein